MKWNPDYALPASFQDRLLLFFVAAMIFMFPLAHIMAIKKALLYLTFLLSMQSIYLALRQKNNTYLLTIGILLLLQIWMLFITAAVADHPIASLMEWKGQWLPSVLCFAIGTGLAYVLSSRPHHESGRLIAMVVFIPAVLYITINSGYVLFEMLQAGSFLSQLPGISDHKANVGYMISILEPILIGDILLRLTQNKRLLPISGPTSSIVFVLMLLSLLAAGARNGIIIMLLALLIGSLLTIKELNSKFSARRVRRTAAGFFLIFCTFLVAAYLTDPRWKPFIATVPVAWDIDHHQAWKNRDLAELKLKYGVKGIDESTYLRIAWAHEGLRLLVAHPWGTEIGRNTFYRLESEAHGQVFGRHSHNGWIDFGLNVGFPGLLLWAAFFFSLGHAGWKAWRSQQNVIGLALLLLVIMLALRAFFDSTFRDHIIQQFMLVAGLLFSTLCLTKQNSSQDEHGS